jgi:hypothetical protein
MPGGYQLGHSLAFLQGLVVGVWFIWALVLFTLWLCGLQLLAYIVGKSNRGLTAQWILRLLLLVKSAPTAAFFGLMAYVSMLPTAPSEFRGTTSEAWELFAKAVIWFGFVPSMAIFGFSIRWVLGRVVRKMRTTSVKIREG